MTKEEKQIVEVLWKDVGLELEEARKIVEEQEYDEVRGDSKSDAVADKLDELGYGISNDVYVIDWEATADYFLLDYWTVRDEYKDFLAIMPF